MTAVAFRWGANTPPKPADVYSVLACDAGRPAVCGKPMPTVALGRAHELSPVVTIATLAEVGALVGDPARANMLVALLENAQLTARDLAERAGVTPQTASGHLAKLRAAGLVGMRQVGRHRLHRITSPKVVRLLEAMHSVGEHARSEDRSQRLDDHAVSRLLRTCHDHLAGRLAVDLAGALAQDDGRRLRMTSDGRARLARWGLAVSDPVPDGHCTVCFDWSERRPHLGGWLGAALLRRSMALGWVARRGGRRDLRLTASGAQGFHQRFGISFEADACRSGT